MAWRAASPRASSSPAHVFCGAASHTLASGRDIKARAEDAQRSPCRPRLHCQAGLSIWSSGCKSALGASFPKPSDGAISCINANVRLLLGAGRCGHTSGLPVRPRAGRPPAPQAPLPPALSAQPSRLSGPCGPLGAPAGAGAGLRVPPAPSFSLPLSGDFARSGAAVRQPALPNKSLGLTVKKWHPHLCPQLSVCLRAQVTFPGDSWDLAQDSWLNGSVQSPKGESLGRLQLPAEAPFRPFSPLVTAGTVLAQKSLKQIAALATHKSGMCVCEHTCICVLM